MTPLSRHARGFRPRCRRVRDTGMLLLLLGAAVIALGLQAGSSARTRLLRNLRDGV